MEQPEISDGVYFSPAHVQNACDFIESLTLTKATKSRKPEAFQLLQHSRRIVAGIYGWRKANGDRLVEKVFAAFGRKQAKTQTAAGIVAYEFFMGDEPQHEIYFIATAADQAAVCYNAVRDMILQDASLYDLCDITDSRREIRNRANGNIMKALSADGKKQHGSNPSLVIRDEYHAFGSAEQELDDAMTTGSMSRQNPLLLTITTAGSDKETPCGREYDYACAVRDGKVVDPSYLPIIYEVPEEADWTDRKLWRLALPLLDSGHHSIERYESEFAKAQQNPLEQNKFRRLYLNQWTSSETQWIPILDWDACEGSAPSEDILRSSPCWAGLDLGAVRDLTALALVWALPDGTIFSRVWGYLPHDDIKVREKRDAVPYGEWIKAGWIKETPGNVTDWRKVTEDIKDLSKTYQIQAVAYDAWGARDTAAALAESGIEVIQFGQAFKHMHPAVSRVEELIYSRRLMHNASPVLRWCIDNSMVKADDNGHKKLVKPQRLTNSKRIDLAMALVMAAGVMTLQESYSDPYSDGRAKLN